MSPARFAEAMLASSSRMPAATVRCASGPDSHRLGRVDLVPGEGLVLSLKEYRSTVANYEGRGRYPHDGAPADGELLEVPAYAYRLEDLLNGGKAAQTRCRHGSFAISARRCLEGVQAGEDCILPSSRTWSQTRPRD